MGLFTTGGAWPVVIDDGDLVLRPLRNRDRSTWEEVRELNREWLEPWEATRPEIEAGEPLPSYFQMISRYRSEAKALRSITLGLWYLDGGSWKFIGQITLGGIVMGAYRGAHIGYWIDQRYANRGITTRAVNLIAEFGFHQLHLHRIEINLRPENAASTRVAEKAGFIFEGFHPRYLHINGGWRDHNTYVKENPAIR